MGRHIIRPLGRMHESRVSIGHQITHEDFDVPEHIGIRVLAKHQRCAGMRYKEMAQADLDAGGGDSQRDLRRDLISTTAASLNDELGLFHRNPMTPERFARLKHALARRQHDLTVLADGVHKDHNVSAIIRTCDAVGVAGIHVTAKSGGFRRHHMIAGGSRRWVDVELHRSAEEAYSAFRSAGLTILAAHAGPNARDFRDTDFTKPLAIVLGAELTGPSPYALANADGAISIPMQGLVESLNVSVAAAVILFEAQRQRTAAGLYERPPADADAFDRKLFEWAYPEIAKRCQRRGLDYPALDSEGRLSRNPFEG